MERAVATTALVLGFIVLGMWWLEDRFGSSMAFNVLMGITHLLAFGGGALLSYVIMRGSLRSVIDFSRLDAQVDRYRMQSFKAQATGDSAMKRAAAQMQMLDARRIDRLAQDRARVILGNERQAQNQDTWNWDDEDEEAKYHQEGWE